MNIGQQIAWNGRDGSRSVVTVEGYATHREALQAALRSAVAFGWTLPRWWQWWRRGDLDYTAIVPEEPPTLTPRPKP